MTENTERHRLWAISFHDASQRRDNSNKMLLIDRRRKRTRNAHTIGNLPERRSVARQTSKKLNSEEHSTKHTGDIHNIKKVMSCNLLRCCFSACCFLPAACLLPTVCCLLSIDVSCLTACKLPACLLSTACLLPLDCRL